MLTFSIGLGRYPGNLGLLGYYPFRNPNEAMIFVGGNQARIVF
jgi:hypothetical protein